MSQYAYIPLESAVELILQYGNSWLFKRRQSLEDAEGVVFKGLEEKEFSNEQKAEIENLGGEIFNNAELFLNWFSQFGEIHDSE